MAKSPSYLVEVDTLPANAFTSEGAYDGSGNLTEEQAVKLSEGLRSAVLKGCHHTVKINDNPTYWNYLSTKAWLGSLRTAASHWWNKAEMKKSPKTPMGAVHTISKLTGKKKRGDDDDTDDDLLKGLSGV